MVVQIFLLTVYLRSRGSGWRHLLTAVALLVTCPAVCHHGALFQIVGAFRQFPDFDMMSQIQFEEFVQKCPLPNYCKEELRVSNDRANYYRDHIFWVELNEASTATDEFNNYLALNSIFLPEPLQKQFRDAKQAAARIVSNEQRLHQDRRSLGQYAIALEEDTQDALKEILRKIEELKPAVQRRLGTG